MLDPTNLYFIFSLGLGVFIQGIVGFGFGLITVPLLAIVFSAKSVIPFVLVLSQCVNILLIGYYRRSISLSHYWPLHGMAIVGLPVGFWVFSIATELFLKAIIGCLVLAGVLVYSLQFSRPTVYEKAGLSLAGFFSGCLTSAAGTGGLPIVFFFLNQNKEKTEFKGNMGVCFVLMGFIVIPLFWFFGLITRAILLKALLYLPWTVACFLLGLSIAGRVNQGLFRRIVLVLLFVIGLVLLLTTVGLNDVAL